MELQIDALTKRYGKMLALDRFSAVFNCEDRGFVNHIGKVRTHSSGGRKRDSIKVHRIIQQNIFCMNLQNFYTALQVGSVYNHTPVKTPRTQQRRIQNLRTVGSCQNQKPFGSIEAIHLSQKLIQSLLTLVIPSAVPGVTALSDGINLINKNNAWCIFLGFLK